MPCINVHYCIFSFVSYERIADKVKSGGVLASSAIAGIVVGILVLVIAALVVFGVIIYLK